MADHTPATPGTFSPPPSGAPDPWPLVGLTVLLTLVLEHVPEGAVDRMGLGVAVAGLLLELARRRDRQDR